MPVMNPLIEVSELQTLLSTAANVYVADCRFNLMNPEAGQAAFSAGHIPGAQYWNLDTVLSDLTQQGAGRHPLPTAEAFQESLQKLGVSKGQLIVVYDDQKSAFASRAWWLLRYYGHDNVRILNGGFAAWSAAGHPISADVAPAERGDFVAVPKPAMLVTFKIVLDSLETRNEVLVDARDTPRYLGEVEPLDPVAGHIPGALNKPASSAVDDNGFWLPAEQQQTRWSDIDAGDNLVLYCGSGVTACVNAVSRCLAGLPEGRVYAGSWSQWCNTPGAPVEVGNPDGSA